MPRGLSSLLLFLPPPLSINPFAPANLKKTKKDKDQADKLSPRLRELKDAAKMVVTNAEEFAKWEVEWDRLVMSSGGLETNELGIERVNYNNKMSQFETLLLDLELGGGVC